LQVESFLFAIRNVDNLLLRGQLLVDRSSLDAVLSELSQKCLLLHQGLSLVASATVNEVVSQGRHILSAYHDHGKFPVDHASLEKLAALSSTKSSDSKSTLMHFLAKHLAEKHADLLREVKDVNLKALINCKGVKLNDIRGDISALSAMELRLHKSCSLQHNIGAPVHAPLVPACGASTYNDEFTKYRQMAIIQLSESKAMATKTMEAFTAVRVELHEAEKCSPDDMLMSVLKLLEGLRTAASENARKAVVNPAAPPTAAHWRAELAAKIARRAP
jgi:hypothetical protein